MMSCEAAAQVPDGPAAAEQPLVGPDLYALAALQSPRGPQTPQACQH